MLLIICSYSPPSSWIECEYLWHFQNHELVHGGRISAPFLPFRGVHGMLELLIYSSFGTSLIEQQDPFGEHDTTHQDTEHMLQLRTAQLQCCAPCALHCAIRIGVVVVFQDIPMANYKHKSFVYTLFWCTFRIWRCWHYRDLPLPYKWDSFAILALFFICMFAFMAILMMMMMTLWECKEWSEEDWGTHRSFADWPLPAINLTSWWSWPGPCSWWWWSE